MSGEPVISVENVSKAYRIWETPSARLTAPLQETLAGFMPGSAARWLKGGAARSYRDFYALRDVAFEVRQGEAIGIVGRNGSGKSTLLQIIAGTLQPTAGTVKVKGRVAALLELGSGFNPEFTGRENVYLNGSVLGMSRPQIDARFDEIAAFADIGDFIDQPAKTYSSGMILRLAFAVQTKLDPDILIVDEALAVGDEAFQRKCYARMDALRASGTTILLVTHASTKVVEFCSRSMILHGGRKLMDGLPKPVVQQYQRLIFSPPQEMASVAAEIAQAGAALPTETAPAQPAAAPEAPKDDASFDPAFLPQSTVNYPAQGACIESVRIQTPAGRQVNQLVKGQSYEYCFTVRFDRECRQVRLAQVFKTISGVELGGTVLRRDPYVIARAEAGQVAQVSIGFKCLLNPGTYFGNAGVMTLENEKETYLHRIVDAVIFRVLPEIQSFNSCYVDFEFSPRVVLLPAATPGTTP